MAGIRGTQWTKVQAMENNLMERAWRMYKRGFTPVDISLALEQPINTVRYWIGLCENVSKMQKRILEEIEG